MNFLRDACFGMRENVRYLWPVITHALGVVCAHVNRRALNILYVADCLILMLITLGGARIGETLSSVSWDLEHDNKNMGFIMRPLIDWIMRPIEKNHCLEAYRTYLKITGVLK